jgi:hypothetical protein
MKKFRKLELRMKILYFPVLHFLVWFFHSTTTKSEAVSKSQIGNYRIKRK